MPLRHNSLGILLESFVEEKLLSPERDFRNSALPFRKYAEGLIADLTGRAATEKEIEEGAEQLLSAGTAIPFISKILRTKEFRRQLIEREFQRYLGRAASEKDLNYWVEWLAARNRWHELTAALVSGEEYVKLGGGAHPSFVRTALLDLTGARAERHDMDVWIGLLDSHSATRLGVALHLVKTPQHAAMVVENWYLTYLGRHPAFSEIEKYVISILENVPESAVLAELLASKDYFRRCLIATRAK